MDDQSSDREGRGSVDVQPMFSDDADFLPDSDPTDALGGSLSLGLAIGCLLGLIATIVLVAIIAQIAVNSPPGQIPEPQLFRIALGGISAIVAGMIVTIRAVVAIGERSKGRFSLLSLLVLVTLLSLILGFIGYALRR